MVQLRSWGKLYPSECELQFLDRYRLEYGLKNGKNIWFREVRVAMEMFV